MTGRRIIGLAVPAVASLLSACGGSSSKAPSTGTATGTAPAPAATTTTVKPTATATSGVRSVAGSVVANEFGDSQVTLVVKGGKIQDVRYSLPSDRARSAAINVQAGPLLRQEVLQAQSAAIDVVSGATATSESFARSLQVAVQRAHLGA